MSDALVFVLQSLVILALPYALWRGGRLSHAVPWVVIQILAGIALGPSVFGRIAPGAFASLFTPASLAKISGIASIAVLFFGFIAGLHLDTSHFRNRGRGFAFVAASSVLVPTILGAAAGFWVFARFPEEVGTTVTLGQFMAAFGISAGVTALPVLAAILTSMRLMRDRIGQWALGLAAVNDASLWVLLSILLADAAGKGGSGVLLIMGKAAVYFAGMFWIVRPVLKKLVVMRGDNSLTDGALVGAATVAIASGAITEAIGLHYILGAFVAGAIFPKELRWSLLEKIQKVVLVLLMPFFFMLTGLATRIDFGASAFTQVFLVAIVAAVVGKVAGTAIPARLTGEPWHNALALGTLMQTKGLMEVIVLTVLKDTHLISANVFSALIAMAVVSTAFAMPLTRLALTARPVEVSA
jgi:Kef-type K+ transport system membrane component KefB